MTAIVRPSQAAARAAKFDATVAKYRPMPGIPDEFVAPDGRPRAHWLRLFARLGELGPDEIERRFSTADRHIRDTGVSYRAYGDLSERSWPLSHLPVLIEAEEWREIAAGVEQRAELLDRALADIYGPGRLASEGILPAAAVTGSPDYLHPVQGIRPPGGGFLQLYAADLGRGPDGRWWVLGDRTQAPSGAGYTLANRLVLSRAFPALYGDMNVARLAPFFQGFRAGLAAAAQRADPRICLLTPGPFNETYFEQAYLARYLGFLLVEGGDLTMRDGHIHVRTVAGLKRADVLWRRIDADFADPLELNSRSHLGVPGLIDAVRAGGVVVANALGSGLLEAPVLMSFMPALCRHLLGADLRLPNIATWWCGQEAEREEVIGRLDDVAIAGAFGNAVPGFPPGEAVIGAALQPDEKARIVEAIRRRGVDYVAQEVVNLSTTPVWTEGALTPRPFVLRVYAARTPDGWTVMPGGFCRISDRADARAVSMGGGVRSADVWVLSETPVERVSLLPADDRVRIRRLMGNLPSRAADNLFWFGRYLERVEATLRLIRCFAGKLIDTDAYDADLQGTLRRMRALFIAWGATPEEKEGEAPVHLPSQELAAVVLHGGEAYGSVFNLVRDARRAASFIRERLSADAWRLIEELHEALGRTDAAPPSEAETFERAETALQLLAAISGLAQENMNRGAGWHMLDAGRRVERGINTCRFARHFIAGDTSRENLDVLLDLVDSQITYRSRYLTGVAAAPVGDMVVLDPFNPRSVAFQVERLEEHLDKMPLLSDDGMPERPRRLVVQLGAEMSTSVAAALDPKTILGFEQSLLGLADAIAQRYFLQGPHVARADKSGGLG